MVSGLNAMNELVRRRALSHGGLCCFSVWIDVTRYTYVRT